jgi:imidazolonepropionase-like amidohydrolase
MIYTSGPSFNGNSAPTADIAVKLVTEQKQAGYDFLNIHPGLKRGVFDALVATAGKVGIRFAGHVPTEVGLNRALVARIATIDHFDGYIDALVPDGSAESQGLGVNLASRVDESRIASLVARTKTVGTRIVPTQILLENSYGPDDPEAMAKWPEMRYADPRQVAQWVEQKRKMTAAVPLDERQKFIAIRRKLIKALHDADHADIPILLGSDSPQMWNVPGFSIHRELATYVAAGLEPHEALATGTRNVAAFFGTLDRAGTIEAGKRADLVLLDANPLLDISNTTKIAGVVLGGRWLPKSEIDRRLNGGM